MPKKAKTTKQFIEEATVVHNGYFSYEKTEYKKSSKKVTITCPEHGDFEQTPNSHLDGRGCVKCRYSRPKSVDTRESMVFDLSSDTGMKEYIHIWKILENPRAMCSKKHKEFMKCLEKKTEFLDFHYSSVKNTARLMCFIEEVNDAKKCHHDSCDNVCAINANTNDGVWFAKFCSYKCAANDEHRKERLREYFADEENINKRNATSAVTYQNKAREMGLPNPESYTHPMHFNETVEKTKKTHSENWDGGHPMRDASFMSQRESRFVETYGVTNPMKLSMVASKNRKTDDGVWKVATDEAKQKRANTWGDKYGGHPMKNEDVKMKMKKTSNENYGRDYPNQSHISQDVLSILDDKEKMKGLVDGRFLSDVGDELGVHTSTIQRSCAKHGIYVRKFKSKAEVEIESILDSIGIEYQSNVRLFENKEVDIYIPSKKIAIEYNGMYWHCEKIKSRGFHQDKSLTYKKNGVQVIHIWEDNWLNPIKKQISIDKIKSKLGVSDKGKVYARKTVPCIVTKDEAKPFFDYNHIQGHVDATLHIGLKCDDTIVAIMSFKRLKGGVWDLSRYATSTSVVGGMSKCLAFFKRNYEWNEIFTFASLDYSVGDSYEKIGFENKGVTPPNMWYMKEGQWVRLGRRRFMKKKLPTILDTFDESLTEAENMHRNGYTRIYDAGSIKYSMKNA